MFAYITKSAEIHALYVFVVHLCKDLAQHNGHKSYGGTKYGEDDEIGAYLVFGAVHNAIRFQLLKTYHCELKETILDITIIDIVRNLPGMGLMEET